MAPVQAQQAPAGVAQHQQCAQVMQQRCNHRPCRTEPAKSGEGHNRQGPAQTDDHVDLQSLAALATQAHTGAEPTQASLPISTMSAEARCDACTARAHRHTDDTGLERQGVVDPVPDHHRPKAAANFLEHAIEFVLRQCLRLDIADADIARQRVCDALPIPG